MFKVQYIKENNDKFKNQNIYTCYNVFNVRTGENEYTVYFLVFTENEKWAFGSADDFIPEQ